MTADTSPDRLTRFLLEDAGVRGVHVRLDETWAQIRSRAEYPTDVAAMLGEAVAASALFTGHVKVDGRLSVQLRGDGALRTLFAECTGAGTLRAIATLAEGEIPDMHTLSSLGPDALLAITIENPGARDQEPSRYQGLVGLDADTLSEAFEGYFRQSEQLPTRLLLAAADDGVSGLMLQKLPGDEGDLDGWERASALFDTLAAPELMATPVGTLLHRLFHEGGVRLLGAKPLRFACSCSRERVSAMLESLGEDEARAAVEGNAGQAEIRCEFCGETYRYSAEEVATLFVSRPTEWGAPDRLQ
ncbi:MAG: Hsp33 family molecular chaperone HslO [Lysobacter sp.]|nr:Hsp33 family molecular chaperone HslO [Lysobacter sp.]